MTRVVPFLHVRDARAASTFYELLGFLDDVDGLYARLAEAGVEVAPPEDAPWAREIEVRDPDGNRLRIGTLHEG